MTRKMIYAVVVVVVVCAVSATRVDGKPATAAKPFGSNRTS